MKDENLRDNARWRDVLSQEQYRICREKGTERAFTGEYWNEKRAGQYLCKCCGTPLFDSSSKYDSGSGWPSFYQPIDASHVGENADHSLAMTRIEIVCAKCDSHLGHVFPDGPQPTGMRYCVNSASLTLKEE